jgi:hypothetical protein
MDDSLPVDAGGLTPEWLTQALSARYPGVRVAAVQVLDETAATNAHVRIGLTYDEAAGAPATMFCKLPPADPAHRVAIGATGMGAREARFYADLAPTVSMRVPTPHYAAAAANGDFILLLEDLSVTGCRVSDGTWGLPPEIAPRAMEDLAALHVRFEDPARLQEVAPWVSLTSKLSNAREFTVNTLRWVIDNHSQDVSKAYAEVGEIYIAHHEAVEELWTRGPQTLIHGDPHLGNVFVDGDRVGFLDWGLMTITTPMRDVSYFINLALDADGRRASERDLIQHYVDVRKALGGTEISFDDAWTAHRLHAGYTVIASFLSFVPPYNAAKHDVFNGAFRDRSMAALDDLDTVDALREALA